VDLVIDLLQTLLNRDTVSNSASTFPNDFSVEPIGNAGDFYEREKKLNAFSKQPDSDENFKSFRRNLVC